VTEDHARAPEARRAARNEPADGERRAARRATPPAPAPRRCVK
jgi:hypothetical protein